MAVTQRAAARAAPGCELTFKAATSAAAARCSCLVSLVLASTTCGCVTLLARQPRQQNKHLCCLKAPMCLAALQTAARRTRLQHCTCTRTADVGVGNRGQACQGCGHCTGLHLLQSSGRARAAGGTRRRHQRRRAVQSGPRHALQQRQEEDAPAGQMDAACLLARRTAAAVAGARRRAAGRRDGAAAGCSCRGERRAQLDDD